MSAKLHLQPPNGQPPESWLVQFDKRPVVIPEWPESTRLAVVSVTQLQTADGPLTTAAVLLSPAALEAELQTAEKSPHLFFVIPRTILLRSPDICPGLTLASWDDSR